MHSHGADACYLSETSAALLLLIVTLLGNAQPWCCCLTTSWAEQNYDHASPLISILGHRSSAANQSWMSSAAQHVIVVSLCVLCLYLQKSVPVLVAVCLSDLICGVVPGCVKHILEGCGQYNVSDCELLKPVAILS